MVRCELVVTRRVIDEFGRWIEDCINESIPPIIELEEALRNGITLAKIVRVFAPELIPRIFEATRLQFRHSDNINAFFKFVKKVDLPEVGFTCRFILGFV